MIIIEQPYQIPEGYLDFPFAYVFDASSLTDGNDYQGLGLQIQTDADFRLRHIAGVPLCIDTAANGGRWNYQNASRQYANGNPSSGIGASNNWTVVPEKLYPVGSQLLLDLYKVLRAKNACGEGNSYLSQIALFGTKRFPVGSGYPTGKTTYKYYSFPQTYTVTVTISDGFSAAAAVKTFTQSMDQYDFELQRISIGKAGATGALATNDFQVTLYDPNRHQMSSAPLNQSYINSGMATSHTFGAYQSVFPVPPIVYPLGSVLSFDVVSKLCDADVPQTYYFDFIGQWRIPCSGRNPGY